MRFRTPFVGAFGALSLLAGYLGLNKNLHFAHDKLLHGGMFFLLALTFYWIIDTYRKRCMQLTAVFVGGILGIGSEFVQSVAVPSRSFDPYDILANLVGCAGAIFICGWYHSRLLERRRQARYELLRGGGAQEAPNPNESGNTDDTSTELETLEESSADTKQTV